MYNYGCHIIIYAYVTSFLEEKRKTYVSIILDDKKAENLFHSNNQLLDTINKQIFT